MYVSYMLRYMRKYRVAVWKLRSIYMYMYVTERSENTPGGVDSGRVDLGPTWLRGRLDFRPSWPATIKITKKANSTLAFLRQNLRHCPEPCRRKAYISLVHSVLEYRSIVLDPYYVKDINRIEKIQRQAVRFISGDYATREPGCISKMLKDPDLPSLQDRRKEARLTFFYKEFKGLVPAISPDAFLNRKGLIAKFMQKKSRLWYQKHFKNSSIQNTKFFIVEQSNTVQYSSSFFSLKQWETGTT